MGAGATAERVRLVAPIVSPDALQLDAAVPETDDGFASLWEAVDEQASSPLIPAPPMTARPLLSGLALGTSDLLMQAICLALGVLAVDWTFLRSTSVTHLISFELALAMCYGTIAWFTGLFPATGMNPVLELRRQVSATFGAHLLVLVIDAAFDSDLDFDALVLTVSCMLCAVLLPVSRAVTRRICARFPWWGESILILGSGTRGHAIYEFLARYPHRGLRPAGIIRQPGDVRSLNGDSSAPILGDVSQLLEILTRYKINWVAIAAVDRSTDEVKRILSRCSHVRNVILLNSPMTLPTLWARSYECAGFSGMLIRDRLQVPRLRGLKRLMDVAVVLLASPVVLPIVAVIAVLIKLQSPGPVFYAHPRIGRGGRIFHAWKIRTMVQNADRIINQYLDAHPEYRAEWEQDYKLKKDPRIIRGIGKLLRKTSLDELPQLWNVLRGEMSIVGPRPIVEAEVARYREVYPLYLRVQPGITGLWQISGRNNTTYDDRIGLDAYYVRNWSPWLDYFIVLRTVRTLLFFEGAY